MTGLLQHGFTTIWAVGALRQSFRRRVTLDKGFHDGLHQARVRHDLFQGLLAGSSLLWAELPA